MAHPRLQEPVGRSGELCCSWNLQYSSQRQLQVLWGPSGVSLGSVSPDGFQIMKHQWLRWFTVSMLFFLAVSWALILTEVTTTRQIQLGYAVCERKGEDDPRRVRTNT
jgi:hypothetical protein